MRDVLREPPTYPWDDECTPLDEYLAETGWEPSEAERDLLALVDTGRCTHPGCDAEAPWDELNWYKGGPDAPPVAERWMDWPLGWELDDPMLCPTHSTPRCRACLTYWPRPLGWVHGDWTCPDCIADRLTADRTNEWRNYRC